MRDVVVFAGEDIEVVEVGVVQGGEEILLELAVEGVADGHADDPFVEQVAGGFRDETFEGGFQGVPADSALEQLEGLVAFVDAEAVD